MVRPGWEKEPQFLITSIIGHIMTPRIIIRFLTSIVVFYDMELMEDFMSKDPVILCCQEALQDIYLDSSDITTTCITHATIVEIYINCISVTD